jgi:hypothetical protein
MRLKFKFLSLFLALSMQLSLCTRENYKGGVVTGATDYSWSKYCCKSGKTEFKLTLMGGITLKLDLEMYCFSFLGMENKLVTVGASSD